MSEKFLTEEKFLLEFKSFKTRLAIIIISLSLIIMGILAKGFNWL